MQTIQDGEWPNVAITPGTDRHAATGERVKRPSDHGSYEARRATEWTRIEPNDNLNAEGGVTEQAERSSDGNADTREKLEAENARLRKNEDSTEKLVQLAEENAKLRERAERAERKIADQREEIASITFRKNVDRMAPKKLKRFQWPRFASGRKVLPGKDCSEVVFGETGYSLWATDGSDEFGAAYGKSVPDSWKERERLRGDA